MKRLPIVAVLSALASGCVTTQATTTVERPPLQVPHAPPRIIDPAPPPEITQPPPVADLPPERPAAPVAKPRPAPPPPTAAKPDPKIEQLPTEPAPQPPPAAQAPPTLRTPATADTAAAERRVREVLTRTQGVLETIDYQRLTPERRGAYEQAKDSLEAAEGALQTSNFELAMEMAEKAEKLVKGLQGR